jgi:hypothetical protein
MIKKSRRKDAWRDYLRDEYPIKSSVFENKMRLEIRERANKIMSDLLLICEKASEKDKIMIFKNPKTRGSLVIPLIQALINKSEYMRDEEELEDAMSLGAQLLLTKIKFDVPLLIKRKSYRQQKHIELLCKWGLSRKAAKEIATGETKRRFPFLLRPANVNQQKAM